MCIILFAHQCTNRYKLILLSNRDEYHKRATALASFWPGSPTVFSGWDKEAGGSWLSVDTKNRLAALTNIRKPSFNSPDELSRGLLVRGFLNQSLAAKEYLNNLKAMDNQYALFNLLLFDSSGLWHYSNDTHKIQQVDNGIHGLSNASIDTPWPKLRYGVNALKQLLSRDEVSITDSELLSILQNETKPADNQLPNTGVGMEFERLLSSIFIKSSEYGTRCSTLITLDYDNVLQFQEYSYDFEGKVTAKVSKTIPFLTMT